MLQTVSGTYRDGRVELAEQPAGVTQARVIVTFLTGENPVGLQARGIDERQAASLRARLQACEQDWSRPEMDAYDAL